jgi:hypothetical protein
MDAPARFLIHDEANVGVESDYRRGKCQLPSGSRTCRRSTVLYALSLSTLVWR